MTHTQKFCASTFLSTLSLRRATDDLQVPASVSKISIHALLAESDHNRRPNIPNGCISIHALLAESDYMAVMYMCTAPISIHALLAESDVIQKITILTIAISIHALLAESESMA